MNDQGEESKIVQPYYLRLYDAANAELNSISGKNPYAKLPDGLVWIRFMLERGRQLEEIWSKYGNDIDLLIHTIESEKKSND
jgi:hypothetical protein